MRDRLVGLVRRVLRRSGSSDAPSKGEAELSFWRERHREEGTLRGTHYRDILTEGYGLTDEAYAGARVLDIGCGPRGSLEWATGAKVRVGLDPLAVAYLEVGVGAHAMSYVCSGAERMPFPDGSFDIVSSLNSLDHVDDLDATITEIGRVTAPGGMLLLTTEVGHEPTPTEPISFGFDVLDRFAAAFDVVERWDFEMVHPLVHASVLAAVPYDHGDSTRRSGILRARLARRASPQP